MKRPAGRLDRLLWIVAAVLALAAAWQLALGIRQSRQLAALHAEQAQHARENRQLQLATESDRTRLAQTLEELGTLKTAENTPAAADSELAAWLNRVSRLKEWLRTAPEKAIPEMRYLSSNDWLAVTLNNPLDSDAAIRSALGELRQMAKMKPEVAANLENAIAAYAAAHNGEPVPDPLALLPYLKTPLPPEILQRYEPVPEIAGQNDASGVNMRGTRFIGAGRGVMWEKAPVDEDYDSQVIFTKSGGFATYSVSKLGDAVNQATRAFRQANPGRAPAGADELLPYFTTPVDATKLREYWTVENRRRR